MTSSDSIRDPLEIIADDFVTRRRNGESVDVATYASQHPHLADEIRELFPTLLLLEESDPPGREENADDDGDRPWCGKRFGDYQILRTLGRGGMGIVFEAVHQTLDRRVALKMLPANHLLQPSAVDRFRMEARTAAKLHHSNIVPVFDVGEAEGVHYFAMQFIDGSSLDRVIQDLRTGREQDASTLVAGPSNTTQFSPFQTTRLKAADTTDDERTPTNVTATSLSGGDVQSSKPSSFYRDAVRIGAQAAEALHYAHEHGVLHRDLKPSNLLLDREGRPWIADFGLAKTRGGHDLTGTGDVVGTLRYLAPERLRDGATELSDIYSLGVTLYELVVRRPAFCETDRVRLVRQITSEDPPRPRSVDPEIPRDLETVLLKAIEKDPRGRYSTAAEFANDLRSVLEDRPVRARRVGTLERCWRWCRRNPLVSSLTALVFALMLALVVGAVAFALKLKRSNSTIAAQSTELERAWRQEGAAKERALDQLWASSLVQSRASRQSQRVGWRAPSLAALKRAAEIRTNLELRNEVLAALTDWDMRLDSNAGFALSNPTAPVAVSADLRTCATVDESGEGIRIVQRGAPPSEPIRPRDERFQSLVLSADGRYLAIRYRAFVVIWDRKTNRQVKMYTAFRSRLAVDFSPDGDRVAIARSHRPQPTTALDRAGDELGQGVSIIELRSGKTQRIPMKPTTSIENLRFSPDGRRLALATTSMVTVYDLDTRRVTGNWQQIGKVGNRGLAWSQDGRILAAIGTAGGIDCWDSLAGPRLRRINDVQDALPQDIDFLGRETLVSIGEDGWTYVRSIYARRPPRAVRGRLLQVASDGEAVAVQDGDRVKVYRYAPAIGYAELQSPEQIDDRLRQASTHGRLLAAVGWARIHLWDIERGEYLQAMPTRWRVAETTKANVFTEDLMAYLDRWPVDVDRASGLVTLGPPAPAKDASNSALTLGTRREDKSAPWQVERVDGHARLRSATSGDVLAELDLTRGNPLVAELRLSVEGEKLIAVCQRHGIRVWDLRLLRERLREFSADWGKAPIKPRDSARETRLTVSTLWRPPPMAGREMTPIPLDGKANAQRFRFALRGWTANDHTDNLPQGERLLGGIRFYIGSYLMQLGGKELTTHPERIDGVDVNRSVDRIHFLHAARGGSRRQRVKQGEEIGSYVIHYEDGSTATAPIRYGVHLRDFWTGDDAAGMDEPVVWRGVQINRGGLLPLRLFAMTWENPAPRVAVRGIDFVSNQTSAAPFCAAITTEP